MAERGKAAFVPDGELVLSPRWYGARTAKLVGTGYHEAGHLLELTLIWKDNPGASEEIIFRPLEKQGLCQKCRKKGIRQDQNGEKSEGAEAGNF